MPEYTRRPPTAEALQWDGTLEGGRKIVDVVTRSGRSFSFEVRVQVVDPSDASTDRTWIEMTMRGGEVIRIFTNDWLVSSLDHGIEVMPEREFIRQYDVPEQTAPN